MRKAKEKIAKLTTKNFFIAEFNPQKDFFRREYVISFWREKLKGSVDSFNVAV